MTSAVDAPCAAAPGAIGRGCIQSARWRPMWRARVITGPVSPPPKRIIGEVGPGDLAGVESILRQALALR
jgi:hypothetical protein